MTAATTRTLTISDLGRVEGHGGIFIKVVGNEVRDVNLEVHEGSRFYEALLRGKHFLSVQGIITRVCAICSGSHTVAALNAIEDALGIEQSERVHRLRGLLILGASIESHALHVFALALPDYFEADSVITLAEKEPETVAFALKLKQLGNRIQQLIGGRAVHPINTLVGGFGKLPSHRELEGLRDEARSFIEPLMQFVEVARKVEIPKYAAQPTTYMALRPYEDGYRFRGDSICISNGEEYPVSSYRDVVREFTVEHSHAKHSTMPSGASYMVGALARLKLWGHLMKGQGRQALELLFPGGVPDNILLNNWAQVVELVHCLERCVAICDQLLGLPEAEQELAKYEPRAGRGISATEVPRGTLFHEYELDDEGRVVSANVVTPTSQNLANVETDMRGAAQKLLQTSVPPDDASLRKSLAMVTRAYDPCISCSVHLVRLPADT